MIYCLAEYDEYAGGDAPADAGEAVVQSCSRGMSAVDPRPDSAEVAGGRIAAVGGLVVIEGASELKADWDKSCGGVDVPGWEQPMLRIIAKTLVGLAMMPS